MSKKIKRIIGLIVCLALSLCFFACNGEDIKISGKNRITLQAGQTYTIQASGIIGTDVKWTSSDESVATVSGGKVVAIKQGEAVITVSEGKKSAFVTVVVLDNRSYSVTYKYYIIHFESSELKLDWVSFFSPSIHFLKL